MSPRANAKSAAAAQEQKRRMGIEEIYEWNNWKRGDRCGIVDEAGEFVIQYFRLLRGEVESVAVVGGPVWGKEQTIEWRSFKPERLTTKILKRGKKKQIEEED